MDRKPGIFGGISPSFKTQEILDWTKGQIAYADAVRDKVRLQQKQQKRRKNQRDARQSKKKKGKK